MERTAIGFFRLSHQRVLSDGSKGRQARYTARDPIRPFASTAIAAAGKVDGLIQQEQR
jgi:hypothetical protein